MPHIYWSGYSALRAPTPPSLGTRTNEFVLGLTQSGWRDLNPRPLRPEAALGPLHTSVQRSLAQQIRTSACVGVRRDSPRLSRRLSLSPIDDVRREKT